MTNTLTDRERELVEAARVVFDRCVIQTAGDEVAVLNLEHALRAYDPPKVTKYTMPTWSDFVATQFPISGGGKCAAVHINGKIMESTIYNAIREALATEE